METIIQVFLLSNSWTEKLDRLKAFIHYGMENCRSSDEFMNNYIFGEVPFLYTSLMTAYAFTYRQTKSVDEKVEFCKLLSGFPLTEL